VARRPGNQAGLLFYKYNTISESKKSSIFVFIDRLSGYKRIKIDFLFLKMMKLLRKVLFAAMILSFGVNSWAQDTYNAINTVVPFLSIAPDSRGGSMGDAGVATSPDVYSIYWNNAKYAFIDSKYGVGLAYTPWLRNLVNDISIANLFGYYKIDNNQVVSGGLTYSSLGDIDFTTDAGEYQTTYKPNEWALTAGYSRLFSDHFSGSVAFKFIYSNLTGGYSSTSTDSKPGTSVAADIAGYYVNDAALFGVPGEYALGFNIANIGSKMSYSESQNADFIPMNMKIGGSYTFFFDAYNKLTATMDINKLLVPTPPEYSATNPDSIVAGKNPNIAVPVAIFRSFFDAPGGFSEELRELAFSFGAEYWYNNLFALRTGYFYENKTKGNRRYLTAGVGLRLSGFGLDFSYLVPVGQNNSPLANTLRFSLNFDSDSFRSVKSEG